MKKDKNISDVIKRRTNGNTESQNLRIKIYTYKYNIDNNKQEIKQKYIIEK